MLLLILTDLDSSGFGHWAVLLSLEIDDQL